MKLIAVLAGGYSHEKVVSVKSAATIMKYIDQKKYQPVLVIIEKEKWTATFENNQYPVDKNDFTFTVDGHKKNFDGAFNMVHGTPGEDGLISGYFDMLGIKHTCNKTLQGSLTFDKFLCNKLAKSFGATVANSFLLTSHNDPQISRIEKEIGFPCFVKPNDSGSSFGVTKVKDANALQPAIQHAFDNGTAVVVEAFVNGTEVACGIVKLKGQITVLPITEIVPETEFFDFTAKYEGKSKEITPARISEKSWKLVQDATKMLYEKFMLRGFARVDFIIQNEIPYLIEMNTIPGMSEASLVPQQVREYGWTLEQFVTGVADEFFE
ncbi:MAG TPA: D-alanine--D-alanine ligase [Flavobacteriales bacterium]|nr:D-alanine--D-alanine ligase [Flavobacteriales bacterium]